MKGGQNSQNTYTDKPNKSVNKLLGNSQQTQAQNKQICPQRMSEQLLIKRIGRQFEVKMRV